MKFDILDNFPNDGTVFLTASKMNQKARGKKVSVRAPYVPPTLSFRRRFVGTSSQAAYRAPNMREKYSLRIYAFVNRDLARLQSTMDNLCICGIFNI